MQVHSLTSKRRSVATVLFMALETMLQESMHLDLSPGTLPHLTEYRGCL